MTTADEHELLLHTLQRQRGAIANAVSGLSEEQVRSVPSASSMSLGSLLKHVVVGEHRALGINVGGVADVGDAEAEWHSGWVLADDVTAEALLARFDDVAAETVAIVRARSLDDAVDLPEAVRPAAGDRVHRALDVAARDRGGGATCRARRRHPRIDRRCAGDAADWHHVAVTPPCLAQ